MKSALKIIQNDTEIAYELWNFPIENRLFNFCVGKTVILIGQFLSFLRHLGNIDMKTLLFWLVDH